MYITYFALAKELDLSLEETEIRLWRVLVDSRFIVVWAVKFFTQSLISIF